MRINHFSKLAAYFIGAILCANIGLAQTCNIPGVTIGGYYTFAAMGTGAPGSLLSATGTGTSSTTGTGSSSSSTSTTSNTEVGLLVGGIGAAANPFASVGTLYFDGAGNILATSTAQQSGANQMTLAAGTYVLNPNCTITVTLNDVFGTGTKTATATLQGIVLNGGSEIDLGTLQSTNSSGATTGFFESDVLVKLVRPAFSTCAASQLSGPYSLIGTGTGIENLATGTGTSGTGTTGNSSQTEAPFFFFALVQFDGNGNVISPSASSSITGSSSSTGTSSPLGYLQFTGTYTVNPDCTGTMTLNAFPSSMSLTVGKSTTSTGTGTTGTGTGTSTTASTNPPLTLNFILTQATVPVSTAPSTARYDGSGIQFSLSTGTETIVGYGVGQ